MNTVKEPAVQRIPFIRKHRSFFVGLFVLIPLIVIPTLMFYTFVKVELIQGWCHLHATYENSFGLTNGNPVTISGMAIGHVEEIQLEREGRIQVHLKIRRQYQPLIRKNTKALLKQKNAFVGDWAIELTGGTESVPVVADNDTLISELPVGIDKTIDQVTNTVSLIQQILQEILDGRGTIGKLIKEDSIAVTAHLIEKNFNRLTIDAIHAMQNIDSLAANITLVSKNSNTLVDSVQLVIGKINTVLSGVDSIVKTLQVASGDVSPVVNQVRDELGEAEKMMKSLQQGWLFRSITKKPGDPMLNKAP